MVTGRVLQFDTERGYGFIAANDGGEDVFLHASVYDGDPRDLVPGVMVEFETMAGDRGRKAFSAHLIGEDTVRVPQSPRLTGQSAAERAPTAADDDDGLCDVLSETKFGQEVTEILLTSADDLTARHILQVRQSLIVFGRKHGWIDS